MRGRRWVDGGTGNLVLEERTKPGNVKLLGGTRTMRVGDKTTVRRRDNLRRVERVTEQEPATGHLLLLL